MPSTGDKWVSQQHQFYNTDALLVASDLSVATDAMQQEMVE